MQISPRMKVIVHDLVVVVLAWELAWLARFNFALPALHYFTANLNNLPTVVVLQSLVAWRFGLYRGLWRFASLQDLWNIVRTAVVGTIVVALGLFMTTRLADIPRSLLVLYPLFLIVLLGGPRLGYRLWKDSRINLRALASAAPRVLVVGAGGTGEATVREMLRDSRYQPVGLVDDRRELAGARIRGLPVLGSIDDLPALCREHQVDIVILAIASATSAQMQRIVARCEEAGRPFRTVPGVGDLVSGQVRLSDIREVSIDDLLGRDKVELDWQLIQRGLGGRTVLVSGGGGSIGAEICRQVARLSPAALVVIERCEYNLYRIEHELTRDFPRLRLVSLLGDVGDRAAVERALETGAPDIVFHAAAFKHVPILEQQAREAVRNNVLGTRTLAEAAIRHGVGSFILISSDKAVNPTSIMGATKRVAEMLCEALQGRSPTRFVTVRFGNVLGSAGSVVPLFQEQIRAGGPVTVTHRDMTRYFMTIPEAAQLILQSAAMGQGGEIFVLDMGEPIHINYLAEQMIRLAGKVPHQDIAIRYTGLRPGEKLSEELFHSDETLVVTSHAKILLARQRHPPTHILAEQMARLEAACERCDEAAVRAALQALVPELNPEPRPRSEANVVSLRRSQT